jgi:hypothetical protein
MNKKIDAIRSELRSEIEPLNVIMKSNIDGLTGEMKQVEKSQQFVAKKSNLILTTVSEVNEQS